MPILGFGGLSVLDTHLLDTVACGRRSIKKIMIRLALIVACVINAEAVTALVRQAMWLVVAVIVLILVQAIVARLPQPRVKPVVIA
jgi:hypothetical protein